MSKSVNVSSALVAKIEVEAPRIHIYPFSRLIGAPAARWERLISDLEAKEQIVYLYYQPVREAIVRLSSGAGADRDRIYGEMSRRAEAVVHTASQNPVRDNQKAFETFEEKFMPKIKTFVRSLLKSPQIEGTYFGGLILRGLPHMEVIDQKGKTKFVHLYPSSWKDHELDAYMELLTIIVESEFGAEAKDLWCMDLKRGISISRTKSKVRTRQACHEAARLFKRMVDAKVMTSG